MSLARACQVPLDEIVGAPEEAGPRVRPRPFTHHGMTVIPLSRPPGGLQAILPAGPTGLEPEPRPHEGYH
ncbi:hypothetical protein [Streptomyces sp. CBMA29]|uniref:hypothetical protein n=1 Tax=Streptomyces sp. CBMA29 TaxID=1896314 RepID=UPI002948C440|nr:hypothetical protein [Streptomyces sp. CBMA29]MBD0739113.1 hypothetical protein [Streptomyces sp. CBMA29]